MPLLDLIVLTVALVIVLLAGTPPLTTLIVALVVLVIYRLAKGERI
jgi:hypothetical protein